ncbi:pseudouridine synthase, partial [Pelagophyceae sp. CCMP2097]
LCVLYEDADCAVVFKPSGVHTMPWVATLKRRERTLQDALGGLLATPDGLMRLPQPRPAHRLDARVSGCVVVAKTKPALAHLAREFEERRAVKTYVAVVAGAPRLAERGPEGAASASSGSVSTPVEGREALTRFSVVAETPCAVYGSLATLELSPLTGRRHQLRLHCARDLGAPIVGDDLYHALARSDAPRQSAGLFLHALRVSFSPPAGGAVDVEAPLPHKFNDLIDRARRGADWLAPGAEPGERRPDRPD